MSEAAEGAVRLDKFLWAARFYKTRSLASAAIAGGKVAVNGQRAKPAREVRPGDVLVLRQGDDEKTVVVRALSAQRGAAPVAATLYEETAASIARREQQRELRRLQNAGATAPAARPDKRQRRQIIRFRAGG